MNKTELIAAVAEKAGLTKKDVEKTITATLETVKEVVAKGDKVQVVGFGTFEVSERAVLLKHVLVKNVKVKIRKMVRR